MPKYILPQPDAGNDGLMAVPSADYLRYVTLPVSAEIIDALEDKTSVTITLHGTIDSMTLNKRPDGSSGELRLTLRSVECDYEGESQREYERRRK